MAKTDGYFYLSDIPFVHFGDLGNLGFDFETQKQALVTSNAFEIGTKGVFLDKRTGEKEYDISVPDMPWRDDTSSGGV